MNELVELARMIGAEWLGLVKMLGAGIVGYFSGRYKDRSDDVKSAHRLITDSIRELCADAIDYHSLSENKENHLRQCAHIKAKLRQISTELTSLSTRCAGKNDFYLDAYVAVLDSITEYPFEPTEMPTKPDAKRLDRIAVAAEELVAVVSKSKPRIITYPWNR